MSGSDSSKGNPASKRMSNKTNAATRQRSYLRGEKRKEAGRKLNAELEANNKDLRLSGMLTSWQLAQKKRFEKRKAAQDAFAKTHDGVHFTERSKNFLLSSQ